MRIMYQIFFLFILFSTSARGQKEGESCIDDYSNTIGTCTPISSCESAKKAFHESRILPTFCSYRAFGDRIVCCRDGTNILNTAANSFQDDRPVWGVATNDQRRISERKCEEFSKSVVREVGYIPLVPEPETYTLSEAKCEYSGLELIVGGEDAKLGEFPHMAAIGWNVDGRYEFNCGGSLISPRFVLTAAHCNYFKNGNPPEPVVVRLGDKNIDINVDDGAEPIDVAIRQMHIHPKYKSPAKYDDIALFELVTDVKFRTGIRPACLWTQHDLGDHKNVIAIGWGVTNKLQQTAKDLQKVSLPILDVRQCSRLLMTNRHWKNGFVESQMCVGQLKGGQDTCQGDSGAPIQLVSKDNSCIFHIVGVTSFGKGCAEAGQPGVYTRVSSYIDWIESVVWPGQ